LTNGSKSVTTTPVSTPHRGDIYTSNSRFTTTTVVEEEPASLPELHSSKGTAITSAVDFKLTEFHVANCCCSNSRSSTSTTVVVTTSPTPHSPENCTNNATTSVVDKTIIHPVDKKSITNLATSPTASCACHSICSSVTTTAVAKEHCCCHCHLSMGKRAFYDMEEKVRVFFGTDIIGLIQTGSVWVGTTKSHPLYFE
jgi:hypothetical protein